MCPLWVVRRQLFLSVNNRDPKQVPAYKIQSTLGQIIKRKGDVDNDFMHMVMETAWSKCTCCNRCGSFCPHGIDMGIMFGYLRGLCFFSGICSLGAENRERHA